MKILVLANKPMASSQAATVVEHLNSFTNFSKHDIFELSMLNIFPSRIDLNRFDAVVTHYSLSLGPMIDHYLGTDLKTQIKQFDGLKIAFLQDEFREVQTVWKNIRELKIDVLFTCVPEDEIEKVYPKNEVGKLSVINVLTGYVPEGLLDVKTQPIKNRTIDVGYRTRRPPFWLGRLGYEKWYIGEEFSARARGSGLVCDFSDKEGKRLYGKSWVNFMGSCRAVLGVESGASIIDFDGSLEREVDKYVAKNPGASFECVFEKFLKSHEGSLRLHQISPRCFEAAALGTPMVLFEGKYSNILIPNRHFILLKKDFSNFNEVVNKLRDDKFLEAMASRTFKEIALNPKYSYRTFVKKFDAVIENEAKVRNISISKDPYTRLQFQLLKVFSFKYFITRNVSLGLQYTFLGFSVSRRIMFSIWYILPYSIKRSIRPLVRILSK